MTEGIKTIVYPVSDLAKAKSLYSSFLQVEPYMDEPYFVGFNTDGPSVGLDPHGAAKNMTGPVVFWNVPDIKASVQTLLDAGAELVQEVKDVGGGAITAMVRDADGNVTGFIQSA
ncbi:VOC family protein [Nonomuraea sp. NPDC050556]|uniref:VOC family protein n=1 Tax=Nonomuraea sp. NPDC050556 TaxID=3364369 RepID=UPI0037B9FEC0